jgi:type I restriction-modification system DNA methylase subunit
MALFQTSVLKSHLAQLDESVLNKAYKKYQNYFWNTTIQDNIKTAKEEQYQATFLNELFVNILGYTLFPNPNPNLTTEFKNEKNARKADGAILKDDTAIGVIELKGTKTKDLESIRRQAFDYKANQKGCVYVITSNFEKLRFYINDATEFEEFDLFSLTQDRFSLMYLCLQKDQLFNNIPLQIKEASIAKEEEITKAFYKDYSIFKRELFRDLVKKNAKTLREKLINVSSSEVENDNQDELARLEKNVKLTLFQKSQKLIDRFLFIFFAEDRMLLPSNSTLQILNKWKDDWDFGDERPLYGLFKQYFSFLDIGRKGTEKRAEIYAYNGGLFQPDAILDALEIDNDLLYKYTNKLSNYDFDSQVDVNILGHIFENSLNEIESVNAEIEGGEFDKQTSKRKKDGVFYTPKYITKYIVENTVGKLCEEKKANLGFSEEEYFKGRKNRNKTTIGKLVGILDTYRDWLLQITICDPACGSGAFLNQALDFLIKEHSYIDELKARVLGGGLQFPDIENTILENNIYGVDLNDESVEIAKLSLWLRTAQPRRKLNNLSSNIKCGNSLIDSKSVAGNKAFKWENEFSEIFKSGGFDVIIGNPPYIPTELISEKDKSFLEKAYVSAFGRINLYPVFYEKGVDLLRDNGLLSYITPYTILKNRYYVESRKFILKNTSILNLIDFKGQVVFADAAVDSIILTLEKSLNKNSEFKYVGDTSRFQLGEYNSINVKQNSILDKKDFSFNISVFEALIERISKDCKIIKEVVNFKQGIITGSNKLFLTNKKDESTEKVITGSDFNRYFLNYPSSYIKYLPEKLHRPRTRDVFEAEKKILLRQTSSYPICTIDDKQYYTLDTVHNGRLINENFLIEYVVALLNSKLLKFLYENSINETGKIFAQVKIIYVAELPIKIIKKESQYIYQEHVNTILDLNKSFAEIGNTFRKFLTSQFPLEKISKKLQNWHELEFGDFIKELNKVIKATNKIRAKENLEPIPVLIKKDEFEWMELFEENKKKAQDLQAQITATEKEIDQMVYELYGLTEDEIAIVENS